MHDSPRDPEEAREMTRRAIQKKLAKKFQVGDAVTWGNKRIAHRIVEVQAHGVVVDSTSTKFGQQQRDGRLFTFIPFVPVRKYGMDVGPPEHTTMKPEVGRRDVHAARREDHPDFRK
jgi:hypothetical protein